MDSVIKKSKTTDIWDDTDLIVEQEFNSHSCVNLPKKTTEFKNTLLRKHLRFILSDTFWFNFNT